VDLGQFIELGKPQQFYPDSKFSPLAWDISRSIRIYIHFVHSAKFKEITDQCLLTVRRPISKSRYNLEGIPWSAQFSEGPEEESSDENKSPTNEDSTYTFRNFAF